MFRLRFVEEFRDRRIVTNGELYGVEGELVTECRYLNVAGARATIDSEAGVAAHRKGIDCSAGRPPSTSLARGGTRRSAATAGGAAATTS